MWVGIVLGLCFTMTNVQQFAAAGARDGSLAWWSAWLMDPMVSLVLLAVLRAEQITTRYRVPTGIWPRVAKWALLLATYLMNTWTFWAAGSAPGVVLHSVPPLVVVIAAEAITDIQHALTECVQRAEHTTTPTDHHAVTHHTTSGAVNTGLAPSCAVLRERSPLTSGERPAGDPGGHPMNGASDRAVDAADERGQPHPLNRPARDPGLAPQRAGAHRRAVRTRRSGARKGRKLLADYLAEARSAHTPGMVITPAWVRDVTGCSRGLSSKLAAALHAEQLTPVPDQTPQARTEPEGRTA
jgi:hypothetical protein